MLVAGWAFTFADAHLIGTVSGALIALVGAGWIVTMRLLSSRYDMKTQTSKVFCRGCMEIESLNSGFRR
jgi:hypothetical protein